MASLNENMYGGLADSYASRYGIPADIFRDTLNKASGFDPKYSSVTGKGISGLNIDVKGVDSGNVGSSLDFAARILAGSYKTSGSWSKAVSEYLGNNQSTMPNTDAMGNPTGQDEPIPNDTGSKGVLNYGTGVFGNIMAWFSSNAYNFLFGLIGVVIIVATLWTVVKNSGSK